MVWTAILAVLASAGEVTADVGRASGLGACTLQPDDGCWDDALAVRRFAAAADIAMRPREADVRLAYAGGRLLIRVEGLQEQERVEVVVDPEPIRGATSAIVGPGIAEIAVVPALAPGQTRAVGLSLVTPGAEDRAPLYASDAGAGAGWRPVDFVVVGGPVRPHEVGVRADGGLLVVDAPEATVQVTPDLRGARTRKKTEGSPPWTASGPAPLAVEGPPATGWYDVVATWGPPDAPTAQARHRVLWEAAPPPALERAGIHPAPKRLTERKGRLTLRPGAAIALLEPEFRSAAELLSEEVARFTGLELAVVERAPGRGDLWVGREPARGALAAWPDDVPGEDGFRLRISPRDAGVAANDLNGAVYGALALADALGEDGAAPAMEVVDWPDVRRRVLFHRIDGAVGTLDPQLYGSFLRRVAARGRYDTLILTLRGAYRYDSHPELARAHAWDREQLTTVLDAARALGMEVIPGLNSPGHAEWLTATHPELIEDENRRLVCTRHPGTRALVGEITDELVELFGNPAYVHVGHDEAVWRTEPLYYGPERCPRCSGTPRWQLYAEHMGWTIDHLAERDARPIFWADMFVEGWNGGGEGVFRSLALLTPAQRERAVFFSWADIGSPVHTLSERGLETWWGMTGNLDARREGLDDQGVQAGGLALFYATPWAVFSPVLTDYRVPAYHWSYALHAGAALWRVDLADAPVATALGGAPALSAYRPGYRHLPTADSRTLRPVGEPVPPWVDGVAAGEATIGGVPFVLGGAAATAGAPVHVDIDGGAAGVAMLLAGWLSHDADAALRGDSRRAREAAGIPIAWVDVEWQDGVSERVPLRWGIDLWSADPDRDVPALWGTAGATRVAGSGQPARPDRVLWRWDWHNNRPGIGVARIRVETDRPGSVVLVGAATAL